MTTKTKTLLVVLTGSLLALPRVGLGEETSTEVSGWNQNHPEAAAALADLVKSDPEAARRIFLWNRDHPLRSQAFVAWINEHPDQGLDDFIAAHARWPVVDLVIKPYRATFEAFIAWGRAHPDATRDLAAEPKGLSWVGDHVFGDLWNSKAQTQVPTDAPEPGEVPATPAATPQQG